MNVLVTSGGTVAPIDDVRAITNASTGRFGASIVEAALRRGAEVWHLHAPGALRPFDRLARVNLDADFTDEMGRIGRVHAEWRAVRDRLHAIPLISGTVPEYADRLESILREHPINVAILAMAASDFAPEPAPGKLASDVESLTLRCRRLPKVIRSVRDWAPSTYLVGFKLLSEAPLAELIRQAEAACRENRADLTVANDLATVRAGRHTVHLVRPGHPHQTIGPDGPVAELLVDRVFELCRKSG